MAYGYHLDPLARQGLRGGLRDVSGDSAELIFRGQDGIREDRVDGGTALVEDDAGC